MRTAIIWSIMPLEGFIPNQHVDTLVASRNISQHPAYPLHVVAFGRLVIRIPPGTKVDLLPPGKDLRIECLRFEAAVSIDQGDARRGVPLDDVVLVIRRR